MTAAHILACGLLGALWRLLKGATLRPGTAPIAAWTFAPMCALAVAPLCWDLDPGKCVLALIGFAALSAAFLLVDANNGGNGKPLLRFGPFGFGYWIADRWWPAWHARLGEPWLGGTWFGAAAWVAWTIAWRLGA
jgi:hypothetical protein